MKRTFFDKPIRAETTAHFYDEKISAKAFVETILDEGNAFAKNMEHLKVSDRYPEEWMETFCAWSEIEQE